MSNIRRNFKQYVHDFIGNGVYDFLKFLLGLFITTAIGTRTVYELANSFFENKYYILLLSVFTMILSVTIFVIFYKHIKKAEFKIIEMNVNFEYMLDKVIVISEIKIKALRKGLDRKYNRTTWFPDEKTKISCLEKEFSIEMLPKRDTSNEYYVKFNRILKKGEIITFTTKVINYNKHRHFNDFYSREIITPMNKLTIIVVIPAKYGYRYITKEVIKGNAYSDLSSREKFELLNTYTWEIEQPQLGYEYKLLWEKQ